MIHIAICDDDRFICNQIEEILKEYSKKQMIELSTDVFYSGESLIDYTNQGNTYDLIYLDIEMGRINGLEVGHKIREYGLNFHTEIAYVTGAEGYELQLFDVQPLLFIQKPVSDKLIIKAVQLTIKRSDYFKGIFQYKTGHDYYNVPIEDIIYFSNKKRMIEIHTTAWLHEFYGNMESTSHAVSKYRFIQISRNHLVNYQHVRMIGYAEIIMSNGDMLPISRNMRKDLRNLQFEDL